MKTFSTGAALSVVTGRLLCELDELYAILSYVTGTSVYTHQLPRASREAGPHILAQYPQLAQFNASGITRDNWELRLTEFIGTFAATVLLEPMQTR